jgi:glutathione S-transferase
LSAEEATQIAKKSEPTCASFVDPKDPQGFKQGMRIQVSPDVDGGEQPVEGMIQYADHETISLIRFDSDLGEVCVHFPRFGYRVEIL